MDFDALIKSYDRSKKFSDVMRIKKEMRLCEHETKKIYIERK